MMNVNEAVKLFEKKNRRRVVQKGYIYNGSYLFYATERGFIGEDYSDPYFLVDKNGQVKHFLPTSDINGFTKAIAKTPIYSR